jgi:ribulose-phosphate 3-epimerase
MNQNENYDVVIAPSLIAADWWQVATQVQDAEAAGCAWLHFDAMDGHFVPNLTLGPMFLEALRPHSKLHFDAHLMISNPGDFIDDFVKAGANSISVHAENQPHLHRLIARIKEQGVMAGAVLNPGTPVSAMECVLGELDYILVMSVNPGFSGQPFLPLATDKIAYLDAARREQGLKFLIQVDGGIGPATAPQVVQAGADVLVCGSSVFNKKSPVAQNVSAIRAALQANS